ncbi:MAG: AAC(3) family N-acetyltransferase [Armatimonadota bacterium]
MADDLLKHCLQHVDIAWLLQHTEALWRLELPQTFFAQRAAAQYAEGLLREAGLERVERITFPADGAATYLDMTMPMAWEATRGKLIILRSPISFSDLVVADYARHPFHLACGSVSTPPEGQTVRLITEDQLLSGADARGALVVLEAETRPREILPRLLDLGAIGYVSSALRGRYETPDAVSWHNASTEGLHWHVQDDDRPFLGYSVSPRVGDSLRAAARAGEVLARAESDGRRYAGEIDVVTGVIPGDDPREIWLLAHLYEPLTDDNSIGVVGSIAIAKMLQQMTAEGIIPRPRFTLRLVFGTEAYGFSAYAASRGSNLREQTVGALNFDGVPTTKSGRVVLSPAALPFFGDFLLEDFVRQTCGLLLRFHESGYYGDDTLLTDPTVGLPTLWIIHDNVLWHNSAQVMSIFDAPSMKKFVAIYAAWLARMLTLDRESAGPVLARAAVLAKKRLRGAADRLLKEAPGREQAAQAMAFACRRELGRLRDFLRILPEEDIADVLAAVERCAKRCLATLESLPEKEAASSLPERMAQEIIPARTAPGLPHDLHRIPKAKRRVLPGSAIYGPLANLLAGMDGRKSLRELFDEVGWERGKPLTAGEMRQFLGAVEYLTEYGYLATRYQRTIDKAETVAALERVGVAPGDLLLVHSAMSPLGYIEGGADTVIDALLEVVGSDGTLLLPAFSHSHVYIGGEGLSRRRFRPFNRAKPEIWTGRIPRAFLGRPDVLRSLHPTHSVAGCGPLAAACLRDHQETDSPTGRSSPFGKLLDYGGKMLWLGADLASTTFFHFLEDVTELPYLREAICMVENPDGSQRPVVVPKHLPGHREFYHAPGEATKMYRRLLQDGLQIVEAPLGYSTVKAIDARQMYDLGMRALADDPNLFLCDNPECRFCGNAKVLGAPASVPARS